MSRLAVIGAGAMGLAAAYHAAGAGHDVEVFEGDSIPGGMAAHFDFGGVSVERFYHFVCKSDNATFALLEELGLADRMRWRTTSMGYFYRGELHPWGDPIALLRFPHLSLFTKLRYGARMYLAVKRKRWDDLDRLRADDWLRATQGEEAWRVLWDKLFRLKFFEYSHDVSAAWIWARIKRLGTSRRSLLHEELGYIEGGSETLVTRLAEALRARGGRIHLRTPVRRIEIAEGRVVGVVAGDGELRKFDAVIATVPLPWIPDLVPAFDEALKARYRALVNIGVVCVVHKLKRRLSDHFWININDDAIDVPGLVEFSNLRPFGELSIVYVPYYMPVTHPSFQRDDAAFIAESFGYLRRINPRLAESDRIEARVGRLRYAQPVCPPGFLERLPPIRGVIDGLQIADTAMYYPEDRGISESVRLARELAAHVR